MNLQWIFGHQIVENEIDWGNYRITIKKIIRSNT